MKKTMNFLHNVIHSLVFMTGVILFFPNYAYSSDKVQDSLVEANNAFTFRNKPIHPALIKEFQNSLADYRAPMIVSIDVGASFQSNKYYQDIQISNENKKERLFVDFEDKSRFMYTYIGKLDNNIHVLLTWDMGDGTGVFQNLTFVRFDLKNGYDRDGLKKSKRLIMSVVRIYPTKIKSLSDITLHGNSISFKNGKASKTLSFNTPSPLSNMANPASANCIKLGGTLESLTNKNGEYAVCHLPNGSTCEEWKLFRKECP